MRNTKMAVTTAVSAAAALALAGCAGSDDGGNGAGDGGEGSSEGQTLRMWHFEGEDSAMGIAWAEAVEIFEEETGATVEFEPRSFEQIRTTASQVLNSDEAPDVLEYN
ncbi:carbohydrate ABC transporter substrate-binding protein, partial [Georgenia sp. 10Sc9-8]|nr:carbohydrate ABC transporter substrate-binding protein [Georgenia halotolerans]